MIKKVETTNKIIKRLKEPGFWIDNALLIILTILVIILAIKGKFVDKEVIELCNGMPTNIQLYK